MIDPLEAVLIDAAADSNISGQVGSQIAAEHKFGGLLGDWPTPSKGLTINYDGGYPDLYYPRRVIRLEIRCYGETQHAAGQVANAVMAWLRAWIGQRKVITTAQGDGLIYYVNPLTEPTAFHDIETNQAVLLFFAEASVGETVIT